MTLAPFPPEIRVVKEGISLYEAGYSSAVLCPPIAGRSEREVWNGIQVFRPASLAGARRPCDRIMFQSLYFSPAWYRALKQVIAEYDPDVLHVHDVWLGRTAFAARTTQHVVMDLHENMPAAVVEYLKGYRGGMRVFNSVFKRPGRVLRYERSLLSRSDMVLTVVEEARARVLANHPALSTDKVVNIENLESRRFIAQTGPGAPTFNGDYFSVLYIGGFGPHRGIDTLIKAMTHIRDWKLGVRLYLIGARPSQYLTMLQELTKTMNVGEYVHIAGWVGPESVLANIRQSDVGCVPHHANPHTDSTIPHKLYQYMISRKPVLVSSSAPLARTVRRADAGLVFEAGDAADCAEKIRELYENRGSLEKFASNGYRYVMEQGHNWEEESAGTLVAAYDRLLEGVAPHRDVAS